MKIKKFKIFKVNIPMKEGHYSWSNKSFRSFDSTILEIITDEGISGFEICPLGPSYLPSYSEGARIGIQKLSSILIGKDLRILMKLIFVWTVI